MIHDLPQKSASVDMMLIGDKAATAVPSFLRLSHPTAPRSTDHPFPSPAATMDTNATRIHIFLLGQAGSVPLMHWPVVGC
jgi:hypothetical protein